MYKMMCSIVGRATLPPEPQTRLPFIDIMNCLSLLEQDCTTHSDVKQTCVLSQLGRTLSPLLVIHRQQTECQSSVLISELGWGGSWLWCLVIEETCVTIDCVGTTHVMLLSGHGFLALLDVAHERCDELDVITLYHTCSSTTLYLVPRRITMSLCSLGLVNHYGR